VLTSELLRVRLRGECVEPRYLRGGVRERLQPVAHELVAALRAARGEPRAAVRVALEAVDHRPTDRPVVAGLRKLLIDRCRFEVAAGPDPATVREQVFREAAEQRRALTSYQRFERTAVLSAASRALDIDEHTVAKRLYADLRDRELLIELLPIDPQTLLERYDVALAQGVLLRATEVTIEIEGERAGAIRQLFREARFRGLIHQVMDLGQGRYQMRLDGPFSLFSAVQKYGLALALFLPAVLRCRAWRLSASLLWGREREPRRFELDPTRGLVPHGQATSGVSPDLEHFVASFRKLATSWQVERADRIVAVPGEAACVPDLVFTNAHTGARVYLEAFGFWSRQAVWQRIEAIERGLPLHLILAVGKQLRVSEAVIEDSESASLYVYRSTMRPRAVLERLEAFGATAPALAPAADRG